MLALPASDYIKVTNLTEMKRNVFRHPDFFTGLIGRGKEIQKYHDLYSYALILLEVFTRKLPYSDKVAEMGGSWERFFKEFSKNHRLPCNFTANPVIM